MEKYIFAFAYTHNIYQVLFYVCLGVLIAGVTYHFISHRYKKKRLDKILESESQTQSRESKRTTEFNLTPREIQIIHLSMDGMNTAQIANKLYVSSRTISNHKANIYSKMGVRSNAEMCRKAKESGI